MDYAGLPQLAAIPDQVNCATRLLDERAASHPDAPVLRYLAAEHGRNLSGAVIGSGEQADDSQAGAVWSYAELLERANRIAHVLVDDLGIVPGNRILIRAPNNPMLVACWFAVMKAGAVAVATMPMLRWREIAYIGDKAEVHLALCDRDLSEEME